MLKVFKRSFYKNTCDECSKKINRFEKRYCICGRTYCKKHIIPDLYYCHNLYKSSKNHLPKIFPTNNNDTKNVLVIRSHS